MHQLQHIKIYKHFHVIKNNILSIDVNNINVSNVFMDKNNRLIYKCIDDCCKKYLGGMCKCGQDYESLFHYLLNCSMYNQQRQIYFQAIIPIYNYYNIQINIKNILYPPSNITNQHRKHVLYNLCKYCINTKRFYLY